MHAGQGSGWTIQRGPKSAIWGKSAPGHMRLVRPSPVEGSTGGTEEGGGRLKLKQEGLASASRQASRCGDPGLFELK